MVEFSHVEMQIVPISYDLFSDNTATERFPTLLEEELGSVRGKNQNQNTSRSTKTWLNIFNEWKVQSNDGKNFADISFVMS